MHCQVPISAAFAPLPMTWSALCSVSARMSTVRLEPLQALVERKTATHRAAIPAPLKANIARYNIRATASGRPYHTTKRPTKPVYCRGGACPRPENPRGPENPGGPENPRGLENPRGPILYYIQNFHREKHAWL